MAGVTQAASPPNPVQQLTAAPGREYGTEDESRCGGRISWSREHASECGRQGDSPRAWNSRS